MTILLNHRWRIILGCIIFFSTIYVGVLPFLSNKRSTSSGDKQYWDDELAEEQLSNYTRSNWMKRPTILSRMSLDWNVDLNRIIEKCDRTKVSNAACLRYVDENRQDFMIRREVGWKEKNETMIYHAFWGGAWTDKLSLFCKSWLYTQRLGKAQLWIWMEDKEALLSSRTSIFSSMFMPWSEIIEDTSEPKMDREKTFLIFRKFDWKHVHQSAKEFENFEKNTFQFESDLVRIAILNFYGGMYLDVDTLLLRDLGDLYLSGKEFAYEWSNRTSVNTAVFYLHKQGDTARAIIEGALRMKSWDAKYPPFHPLRYLYYISKSNLKGASLLVLPVSLFDPIWLIFDRVEGHTNDKLSPPLRSFTDVFDVRIDPAQPRVMTKFLAGAWALHWHGNGKWGRIIQRNCWLGLWDTLFDCFVEGECQNLYGETLKT
eukprot:TRINITY_DN6210_c0_g1_i1.p1 TRINITY_DN6210_c0_g1~~TRINITY_DN6210_c0_g1_i1.p1  ORF type:complete len:429 (+),score=61.76 TRINITY_DN6210_c0_g1_i1:159-1445(+)